MSLTPAAVVGERVICFIDIDVVKEEDQAKIDRFSGRPFRWCGNRYHRCSTRNQSTALAVVLFIGLTWFMSSIHTSHQDLVQMAG